MSKKIKWIIGLVIALIAAGGGLQAWLDIFGLKRGQELTTTEKPKLERTERALRVQFKDGNQCDVDLYVSFALIPEKAPFAFQKYGEQSNSVSRVKAEVRAAAISTLERNEEVFVRNNRENISNIILASLKHLENDPGYKIEFLRFGSINCL